MSYLIGFHLAWLLIALVLGGLVGWLTYLPARTRWMDGVVWLAVGLIAVGALVAVTTLIPDRAGYWLEVAVLMVIAYVVGCPIGWALRHLTFAGTAFEAADSRLPKPGYTFPGGKLGALLAPKTPSPAVQPFGITTGGTLQAEPVALAADGAAGTAPGSVRPTGIAVPTVTTQDAATSTPPTADKTPASATSTGSTLPAAVTPSLANAPEPAEATPVATPGAPAGEAPPAVAAATLTAIDGGAAVEAPANLTDTAVPPAATAGAIPLTPTSAAVDAKARESRPVVASTAEAPNPSNVPGSSQASPLEAATTSTKLVTALDEPSPQSPSSAEAAPTPASASPEAQATQAELRPTSADAAPAETPTGAPTHPTGISVPVAATPDAAPTPTAITPVAGSPPQPDDVPLVPIAAAQSSKGSSPAQASLQNAAPTAREGQANVGAAESAPSAGMPKPSTFTSPPAEEMPAAPAAAPASTSPAAAPAPTSAPPLAATPAPGTSTGSDATSSQTTSSSPTAAPSAPATTPARTEPERMPALPDEGRHAGQRPVGLMTARDNRADDLKRIRGIGPQNEGRLHGLGIWHFDQIAAWTPENVQWVGSYLAFHGRIDREKWIDQAKALAAGQETEFSKRVAAGKVATSLDDGSRGQTNVAPTPKPGKR